MIPCIVIVSLNAQNACISDSSFTDSRDSNTYRTIQIGTQIWMAENLAYLPNVAGPDTGSINNPIYYVYGYSGNNVIDAKATDNYQTYGVLYNWTAAATACPPGWHLPTDAEWKTLEMHLGMSETASYDSYRGTDEGGKLKETGTVHWRSPNTGATNESGFTALPGGYRYDGGVFSDIGNYGGWWSATESNSYYAWFRNLSNAGSYIYRYYYNKELGFSVRCLKD